MSVREIETEKETEKEGEKESESESVCEREREGERERGRERKRAIYFLSPPYRLPPMASISSIKMMQGVFAFAACNEEKPIYKLVK